MPKKLLYLSEHMQIIGLGTDIIECERIGRMLIQHGERFTSHVFTEAEFQYCSGRKIAEQHFAGRWAAKEAVLKALGTGWAAGITWTDVEVIIQRGGKPDIQLHCGAAQKADELGIAQVLISISHCKSYATATALAVGKKPVC
jgi:holo-[acyl-carrier protein] synthase